ncbi:MAG: Hsp20/alpha crystallin family protein [Bacteroidia bacterium]
MNHIKRQHSNAFPVMDGFFKDWMGGSQLSNRVIPPVNIKETDGAFAVELVAPGLKKEDLKIEVENGLLTISREVKADQVQEDGKYTRREFIHTSFKRAFTLPDTVNEEGINANYEDGILTLSLPKKDEAQLKTKRMIEIS